MTRAAPSGRRVLVTDGDNRSALAVTRALGRSGHHVIVGDRSPCALAQTSRFCATRLQYPDPARQPDAFVEALAAAVEQLRVDVLLPVADVTTILVTENRRRFEPRCAVPFADAAAIGRAADKADMVRTAERIGVPAPRTVFLDHADGLAAVLDQITYPAVVKPHRSRLRTAAGWASASVRYAADPGALTREVQARKREEFPLLLQEQIVGYGMGVFACLDHGRPIALFGHRRLREKPPSGGVSVLSESIAVPPRAREYAEALFADLRWHGVAMAEFKVDERDGLPRLMEINGRFWGSLQLAVDAGVDFPSILVALAEGRVPVTLPVYRQGVRSRWLWGDVDSLLISMRRGGQGAGKRRLAAMSDFLRFWQRDLHYENPRWSDLKPWLHETAHWVRRPA